MIASKKNLKIVLCANSSWYIYNFRKNTIKALLHKGCKVYIVAPEDEYSYLFDDLGAKFVKIKSNAQSINPLKELYVILSLFSVYFYIKPHFVMNFTPKMNIYSTIAAAVFRPKIINNISGLGIVFSKVSILSKFVSLLYKFSQNFAKKVFFQNEHDMKLFISNKIINKSKCEYLPGSGVDLEKFSVKSAPNDGVIRFIIVCRMLYNKGVIEFSEAAKFFKEKYNSKVEFIAIGFLDAKNKNAVPAAVIDEWVKKGFLIYRGALRDVRPEIEISDCVVLPSTYPEGTPKSLLEAAAMGKPIITTDMPGCSSTVEHKVSGFLCRAGNKNDLMLYIDRIINMSHNDRQKMGLNGRRLVEKNFNEKVVIEKYLNCLSMDA